MSYLNFFPYHCTYTQKPSKVADSSCAAAAVAASLRDASITAADPRRLAQRIAKSSLSC